MYDELDNIDFSGKKVAYFRAGDQIGYADNFQDAMGILEEKISDLGGTTVGYWSRRSYNESKLIEFIRMQLLPLLMGNSRWR